MLKKGGGRLLPICDDGFVLLNKRMRNQFFVRMDIGSGEATFDDLAAERMQVFVQEVL